MRVKFSECAFGMTTVETLRHKVSYNSILPSDDHVDAIKELQEPADWDSLCRFIWTVNYFRKLMSKAAERHSPLIEVLKGSDRNKRKLQRRKLYVENWDARWGPAQVAA